VSFFSGETVYWIYSIALLILGFLLVLLEVFVIPGLNIFGIIGFLTICIGVAFSYLKMGLLPALGVAGLGLVGTLILLRFLIRVRAWRRLVLDTDSSRDNGNSTQEVLDELVGQTGRALTPLRPAGRVEIGERIIDVVSEGSFIDAGDAVEVVLVHGNRIVVQSHAIDSN
jgi:membrane-bound serine protease (ClpP class)